MNRRTIILPFVLIALLTILVGCNLPISPTPTPFVFPTPNLTMTAIFNLPVNDVPPTVTPGAIQTATTAGGQPELPTIEPSPTQVPPTQAPIFPTATVVPAAPATAVPVVHVSSSAVFLSTAPTIDGSWDEWNTTQYPAKFVVFGASKWKNSADLEAAYRVGWDSTNLYLAVKVTDNTYVQNATGTNLYKGDSIELLLDTNPGGDSSSHALTGDDYQLGISPGKGTVGQNPEAYLWFPSSKTGGLSQVKIGAIPMSDGYRVEAAIPWSVFGITPANGQQYGFAVSVSDNDDTTQNVQQKMVSSVPDRLLVDPSTWGTLTLTK